MAYKRSRAVRQGLLALGILTPLLILGWLLHGPSPIEADIVTSGGGGGAAAVHNAEHAENASDEVLGENLGTACTNGQILIADATGGLICGAAPSGGDIDSVLGDVTGAVPVLHQAPATFGAADTTPDVSVQQTYVTGGAVTITDFDDGTDHTGLLDGQFLDIRFAHAVIIAFSGAAITGHDEQDWTAVIGDTMRCQFFSSTDDWHCTPSAPTHFRSATVVCDPATEVCTNILDEETVSPTEGATGDCNWAIVNNVWEYFCNGEELNQVLTDQTPLSACFPIENLAAADDNVEFFMANQAVTISAIGCHCNGTCSTPAQLSLEDRAGNAMTHTAHTCSSGAGNTTYTTVTAANALVAGEGVRFDVDNAVAPETDQYLVCIEYNLD